LLVETSLALGAAVLTRLLFDSGGGVTSAGDVALDDEALGASPTVTTDDTTADAMTGLVTTKLSVWRGRKAEKRAALPRTVHIPAATAPRRVQTLGQCCRDSLLKTPTRV
jgi:hypothetical protein